VRSEGTREREALTAIAEADHSVVALVVAQVVLVHEIQSRGGHAGAKAAERFETQTELWTGLLA
jgi:hypothetical protein